MNAEIEHETSLRSSRIAAHSTLASGVSSVQVEPALSRSFQALPPLPLPTFSGGYSRAALRGLGKNLGTTVQIAGCIIVQLLLQRLDPATQAKWEEGQNASNSDLIPTWESMAEFLEQRCRTLEAMDVALAAYVPGTQVGRRRVANNSGASFIITNSPASACLLCGGWSHVFSACPRYFSLPPESRLGEARRLGLCRKCLQTGHHLRKCLADNCRSCGRRHRSLLHFLKLQSSNSQPSAVPSTSAAAECAEPIGASPSTANALVAQGRSGEIAILVTANILIRSRSGVFVPCRVLLDYGSQVHVITSRLASQPQLRRRKSYVAVSGIGDTGFSVDVLLRSYCSEYSALVSVVIATNITDLQPSFSLDVSSWNIPSNLTLADPQFFRPQRIDLLIGASLFYDPSLSWPTGAAENPAWMGCVWRWFTSGEKVVRSHSPQGRCEKPCSAALQMACVRPCLGDERCGASQERKPTPHEVAVG
ncbi:uncharacterized protein LOC123257013 [Drosophila ananassae]|uniref:uncharacterized protein LOC123257013 n=1 Tax=Drosophila ananassae TaxID=7217 RepID=UPI001CFFD126|nr:uncharacterized protein LOC123257013 [Drosophila ananassae]